MPAVNGFTPTTDIGNNKKGLKRAPRSISNANVAGSGFGNAMPVTVLYSPTTNPQASRKWLGVLERDDTGPGFHVALECLYNGPDSESDYGVDGGPGDPEDVTVTVTVADSDKLSTTVAIN